MRGKPDLNRAAFAEAEERLCAAGWDVFNPAEEDLKNPHRGRPGRLSWIEYIERDIKVIAREDTLGLAMLEDWRNSAGARIENVVTETHHKPVKPWEAWLDIDPEAAHSAAAEAHRLVFGARNHAYGHPADDFQVQAEILRALVKRRYGHDIPFSADFVGLVMAVAVKGGREAGGHKYDNCVDGAGYFTTIQRVLERQQAAVRSGATGAHA
jgi:hypothetical protein